ncbi:hypothetical protein HZ326_27974 [Fusarium oxysporum f. sp. albedinis]|nr:hypothetical protein HZ326_27974 [Fusarium oxysporum f. sp. albedinis]
MRRGEHSCLLSGRTDLSLDFVYTLTTLADSVHSSLPTKDFAARTCTSSHRLTTQSLRGRRAQAMSEMGPSTSRCMRSI